MKSKNKSPLRRVLTAIGIFALCAVALLLALYFVDYAFNGVLLDWFDNNYMMTSVDNSGEQTWVVREPMWGNIKVLVSELMVASLAFWLIVIAVVTRLRVRAALRVEGEISPELREKYLSIALGKAERLEDLINEFFEITRFNMSTVTLEKSRIDLTRLLEQLVFEFMPLLKEKELTVSLDAPPSLELLCDANKLQRVFDNLLRNAVLYSYPKTEIRISAVQTDAGVTVSFLNHGATIPADKLRQIFEQFYRLDAARGTGGGTGLGLAIAKQIVQLHGGTINARSENETIEFAVNL